MSDIEISVSAPVSAPASRAFTALTDWARQSSWILATDVRPVGPQRRGVGDRFEAFTGLRTPWADIGFLDTMVVTEWLEGRSVTVAHTGRVVRGSGTFAVTPRSSGSCDVSLTENLDIPGGRVGLALFAVTVPLTRWAIKFSLQRFARQVQSDPVGEPVPA